MNELGEHLEIKPRTRNLVDRGFRTDDRLYMFSFISHIGRFLFTTEFNPKDKYYKVILK